MMNCLHSAKNGSCPHKPVEGSLFCAQHTNQDDRIAEYLVEDPTLGGEYDRQGRGNLLSLRSEVTLLKAMVGRRLNFAKTEAEQIVAFNQVSSWMITIDKLVNSLHKLEKETSEVLTRDTLMKVARQFIAIISEEIKQLPGYEDAIDRIAPRLVGVVATAANLEHKK